MLHCSIKCLVAYRYNLFTGITLTKMLNDRPYVDHPKTAWETADLVALLSSIIRQQSATLSDSYVNPSVILGYQCMSCISLIGCSFHPQRANQTKLNDEFISVKLNLNLLNFRVIICLHCTTSSVNFMVYGLNIRYNKYFYLITVIVVRIEFIQIYAINIIITPHKNVIISLVLSFSL